MNPRGFYTLFYKELLRFSKVALQTIMAPIITALLFLMVFSHVLEGRVNLYNDLSYSAFLVPGLIMMSLIQNAFANSSSSLIQSKVTGNIVFILLAPISYFEFYLAFVLAATVRALLIGLGVYIAAMLYQPLSYYSLFYVISFALLASTVLGSLGIIAGIWADKFDQLAGFQNFVIMPLSFLSGVFYSIHSLPEFWQQLSHYNPFFYMIDGFRYGFFGVSDVDPRLSLSITIIFLLILVAMTIAMLRKGYKLRY